MSTALLLLLGLAVQHSATPANWTGPYEPCRNSPELRKTGRMSIGVRYDIPDAVVIRQFQSAFDFWARILDAEFHEEPSNSCAVAVVNATGALLSGGGVVARAQFPDWSGFHGWIAIDPLAPKHLDDSEAVATWIHEIGHLLGLRHNPSADSLMYFLDADSKSKLDSADLRSLASLHALRPVPIAEGAP